MSARIERLLPFPPLWLQYRQRYASDDLRTRHLSFTPLCRVSDVAFGGQTRHLTGQELWSTDVDQRCPFTTVERNRFLLLAFTPLTRLKPLRCTLQATVVHCSY